MDKIKILHPNSNKYESLDQLKKYYSNGFYSIISDKEKDSLNYFLESFEDYRKDYKDRIINKKLYPSLPFSVNSIEWKERQKDVKIIDKILKHKKDLSILDIGSWNGWLSNYLTKKGHNLVAINMFTNSYDGLEANKNYKTNFISLQLMTDEIYRIKYKFDVIIFNRNWAYFQNHKNIFNEAKKLLSKEGIIIFTGLPFYKNPIVIKNKLLIAETNFTKKYKIPLLYKSSKGYLTFEDKSYLVDNKVQLLSYQPLKNCIKRFLNKSVILNYGFFHK